MLIMFNSHLFIGRSCFHWGVIYLSLSDVFILCVFLLYIISLGDDLSLYVRNRIISHLKGQAYVAKLIRRVLADN